MTDLYQKCGRIAERILARYAVVKFPTEKGQPGTIVLRQDLSELIARELEKEGE